MKYELENEQLHVEFQSFGGALSSIRDYQGTEFLWQGDKNYWSGQAPVLFPICGSIRDDKAVTKDGKNLKMPRHGIVRKEGADIFLDYLSDQSKSMSVLYRTQIS